MTPKPWHELHDHARRMLLDFGRGIATPEQLLALAIHADPTATRLALTEIIKRWAAPLELEMRVAQDDEQKLARDLIGLFEAIGRFVRRVEWAEMVRITEAAVARGIGPEPQYLRAIAERASMEPVGYPTSLASLERAAEQIYVKGAPISNDWLVLRAQHAGAPDSTVPSAENFAVRKPDDVVDMTADEIRAWFKVHAPSADVELVIGELRKGPHVLRGYQEQTLNGSVYRRIGLVEEKAKGDWIVEYRHQYASDPERSWCRSIEYSGQYDQNIAVKYVDRCTAEGRHLVYRTRQLRADERGAG